MSPHHTGPCVVGTLRTPKDPKIPTVPDGVVGTHIACRHEGDWRALPWGVFICRGLRGQSGGLDSPTLGGMGAWADGR